MSEVLGVTAARSRVSIAQQQLTIDVGDAEPSLLPGEVGKFVYDPDYDPQGDEMEFGSGSAYVVKPEGSGRPTGCIFVVHDAHGFRSGRHFQLADAFASQGWLAILPDFSGEAGTDKWFETNRSFLFDYVLPWLEDQHVVAIQCLSLSTGAAAVTVVSKAVELFKAYPREPGLPMPCVLGAVLAHPKFELAEIGGPLQRRPLQKIIGDMDYPLLLMPARDDSIDVKVDGLVQSQHASHGRYIEVVEFGEMEHGFLVHGDVENAEVRENVEWAVELACAFFHRNFGPTVVRPLSPGNIKKDG